MAAFFARTDSASANNPALNLTGDPSVEITFLAQTPTGGRGDLILEPSPAGGVDPDTQVSINGVTYTFTVDFSGTLPTQNSNGANQVPEPFQGEDVLRITVQDYPAVGQVTSVVFMPFLQATQADMDAFGKGRIDAQNLTFDVEAVPVCFAQGTLILTQHGEIPVEALSIGDVLLTLDGGEQPVVWISKSHHQWPGSDEKHKPVLIAKDALGGGRPTSDLVVSPQHKISFYLVATPGDPAGKQVLAPAIGLIKLPRIRQKAGAKAVTYYHVMLPRHAIIQANGAMCESFYPGPSALNMLNWRQKSELIALFPGLRKGSEAGYGRMARCCLTRRQTEKLGLTLLEDRAAGSDPMSCLGEQVA